MIGRRTPRLAYLAGVLALVALPPTQETNVLAAPQTVVTLNPVFQDVYAIFPASFTVDYAGGNDGAVVVVQFGDGTIGQATAAGYQATFSHTYGIDRVFQVTAEVFTSGCIAPCSAAASVLSAFQHCWTTVGGICMGEPPLLPSVSTPRGIPNGAFKPPMTNVSATTPPARSVLPTAEWANVRIRCS
jgi:hypothetical protein